VSRREQRLNVVVSIAPRWVDVGGGTEKSPSERLPYGGTTAMGIGVSIFLIAVGAILTFAINAEVAGVDIDVIGLILMIAGALGLLWTLLIWGPRRRAGTVVENRPIEDRRVERRVYDEGPELR
jgi:Domain of unknown function (DUF6458)